MQRAWEALREEEILMLAVNVREDQDQILRSDALGIRKVLDGLFPRVSRKILHSRWKAGYRRPSGQDSVHVLLDPPVEQTHRPQDIALETVAELVRMGLHGPPGMCTLAAVIR
jgi:hypothetical protein